jgi:hypothetical protein
MASAVDFSSLTLNTEEAREVSQLVFEKTFLRPELNEIHNVMTGVEMDRFIPIMGQFGLVGKNDPGACGVNTESGQIPVSQKTWAPKLISFRIPHCQDDIPDLLKFWKKAKKASGTWEDVSDELMAFITDRLQDAIMQSILRISSMGGTSHSPVGDGAGNELLTVGTDKTYFNMLNGLWEQIFTDQALPTPLTYRYEITENGQATKSAQLALGDTAALDAFRAMYNNIDPRAFESSNLVFQITRTLLNNWQNFLEDKSLVFMLNRAEEGKTGKFSYRGVPIVVRNDWDRLIKAYFDNGTTYYLPHRAVLTDINNVPIGTSETDSFTVIDVFYDKVTKKWYFDVAYKLDVKLLMEYELACAY